MVSRETAVSSLSGAQPCCHDSLQQLPYDVLSSDREVHFSLDGDSPAFRFSTGKSYFKAFRLPWRALPYRIRLQSFALGEHIDKAHLFYPQLALLNGDYQIVRRSGAADFTLSKAGFSETAGKTWGLPVKLEGEFVIDDPQERYLVIFTTDALLADATPYVVTRVVSVILPGLVTVLPTGRERIRIPHSPFGLLYLNVMEPAAAVTE
jgi:maltose operon protein